MNEANSTSVAWVSLGCPKNLVDSEAMLGELAGAGCLVAAPMEQADVIVINTCGFLESARAEALDVIAEALEYKAAGSAKRIVVAGCLPQRDGEALFDTGDIDAILGVHDRAAIVEAVLGENSASYLQTPPHIDPDVGRFRLTLPHTAYLRIAEGCSQNCTFCTIPAIRGPFRSKPADLILAEAEELIGSGAKELNIIAQDTTAWGTNFEPPNSLAALLRELDKLDAHWLRLMYTYPRGFSDELIDTLAEAKHVVPYIDMPLQHIADGVLKRMGRRVSRKDCETLLSKLRSRIPNMAIRTSFIVGFPGETEANFEELLAFVQEFRFDALGVFEYSPEDGTPAAKLENPVPYELAAERAERLMETQRETISAHNPSRIGQSVEVLVDGFDADGVCVGRSAGQAPDIDGVCILTEPNEPGEFIRGEIVDVMEYDFVVEAQSLFA